MIEGKITRWGNSYGILIPKETLEKQHLHEQDEIVITIQKKSNLEKLFGLCKFKKSTKEMLKEIREGYD